VSAYAAGAPDAHPFVERPHRTFLALTWPILLSLIAEPLAGLADTAFVKELGAVELAALGVATTLLSAIFWVFGFLGIGAQTEVAQALGRDDVPGARKITGLALALAIGIGFVVGIVSLPALGWAARLLGATGPLEAAAVTYLEVRLLGLPGSLLMLVAFGALRGLQDMRTPLRITTVVSLLNILLDPIFIFGFGPVPAMGVAGAAWATTGTQWLGALWGVATVHAALGLGGRPDPRDAARLLRVGRDLFMRTGLLVAFLMLATRIATQAGADSGAAHQALRQIWVLTAFLLDAYAITAQSLVGYFIGAERVPLARRVATVACGWGLVTGVGLAAGMLLLETQVAWLLVPPVAHALFAPAWVVSAVAQPLNALSFVTDGIHWGTGDYRYLRNGMLLATTVGAAALLTVDPGASDALTLVWGATLLWSATRGVMGLLRIWPGPGRSPLRVR
jgi:MATE family multidrug resistance protein